MTVRLFLVSALMAAATLTASVGTAHAQRSSAQGTSPVDLYHQGAKLFVDGNNAAALAAVEAGLAQAPDDARLQALRDLIQQQQDESDQQDESQDPQDGEGEQDQDSQDGDQDESQDPQDGDQGDEQDDRSPEAEQDGTSQQPPQPSSQGQGQPQQAGEPDEMTQAQADRLLDAVGGEERLLLREMRRAPTQRRRGDKDW